jgi:hypothetical protein
MLNFLTEDEMISSVSINKFIGMWQRDGEVITLEDAILTMLIFFVPLSTL